MLCVWIPSTFIGAINVPVTQKISNETGTQCDMLSAIGNVVVGSDCFRIGGFRMRDKLNPDFIIPCCIIFKAYIRLGFFISSMKSRQVIVFIFTFSMIEDPNMPTSALMPYHTWQKKT